MPKKGSPAIKPVRLKLTQAQQLAALRTVAGLLQEDRTRDEKVQSIVEHLAAVTKFPVVSLEERPPEFWIETGMKTLLRIPLRTAAGRQTGSMTLAHSGEAVADKSLIQCLETISIMLGSFLEEEKSSLPQTDAKTQRLREEKLELENRLRSQSIFDELTLLPNRSLFPLLMSHHLASARRKKDLVAVMQMEIDRLEEVRTSLGLPNSENIVKPASERMMSGMRDGDVVVRDGEARFLWSLPGMRSIEDIAKLAEKMLLGLSKPLEVEGKPVILSGSVGIAVFPSDGQDPETLIGNAGEALVLSRKVSANAYRFFGHDVNEKIRSRLAFRKELKDAASKQEFILHYQPVVQMETEEIESAEALIRWKKSQGGTVFPGQFLGVAEEFGMAQNFDEWVIRSAWNQRNVWQKEGLGSLRIRINLSSSFFWEAAPAKISRILDEMKADRNFLEFEIKESILMKDPEKAIQMLNDLHKLNIRLCIDDFGTGGLSPFYLKRYPVQTIKIDMSFVRGISGKSDNAPIVAAMISLAKSLKMYVIAEGVETAEELAYLKSAGCDGYQGNLFSPALSKTVFAELRKKKMPAKLVSKTPSPDDKTQPVMIPSQVRSMMEKATGVDLLASLQDDLSITEKPAVPERTVTPTKTPVAAPPVAEVPIQNVPAENPVAEKPPTPPRPAQAKPSGPPYMITCNNCRTTYNALEASWCLCLTSDPTLICPGCHKCFCKAPLEHRHEIWGHAPDLFWDRKRQHESAQEGLPSNPSVHAVRHPLVLIVVDEHRVLRTASRLIRSLGFSVVTAPNGEEGLNLARTYLPDLVLCDALMPKMDGRELCKLLKQDPNTKGTKTVMMTSFSGAGKYRGTLLKETNVDEQLQKPIEFERLRSVLHKLL